MQVGIDVGATKIESVLLEKDGQEKHRSRISCPKNYTQIITSIRDFGLKNQQWDLSSGSSFNCWITDIDG